MGRQEAGHARKEIKLQRFCVSARPWWWWRAGTREERARLQPGFCQPPLPPPPLPRGEAALSLLASGSQACGSVGPAAQAEGARAEQERGRIPQPRAGPSTATASRSPRATGPAPSRCICQGLLLFSKCISRPEPPPAPPLPAGLSLRALRWRRTRPAGSASVVDRPQASGQCLVMRGGCGSRARKLIKCGRRDSRRLALLGVL